MQVLHQLPKIDDPRILAGTETMDDAGVYAIDKNIAIVQTVDVLTPIADDPHTFGQIVAANAMSDVYAMGGKPITGLTIMSYPPDKIDTTTIGSILIGVADKFKEAGAVIIGGHTIKDSEIKCGVAVTGIVKPDSIITNAKAKPGDALILTKPLGTGIISTALKMGKASDDAIKKINQNMSQLNKTACEAMLEIGVSSATDITGFGLLGHALEMAEASRVSMVVDVRRVPIIGEALTLAKQKLFPGGSVKNFEFVKPKVKYAEGIDSEMQMLLCDAQTSGGLLLAIPEEKSEKLLKLLHERGVMQAEIIGAVCDEHHKKIVVEKSG
jgi:selenide,water dikinase